MDMKTLPEIVMDGLVNNGYVIKDVFNVQDAKLVKGNEIPVLILVQKIYLQWK